MVQYVLLADSGEVLGRECETMADITPEILEGVTAAGAPGILFVRPDGSYGAEEESSISIIEATSEEEALRLFESEHSVAPSNEVSYP